MQELNQTMEMADDKTEQRQTEAQGPQAADSAQTVSRAEMQQEIDRVAKRERERGRRQAMRAQEAREQKAHPEENAQPAEDEQKDGPESAPAAPEQAAREMQETTKTAKIDPADALGTEEQRMLGAALAQKTIGQGAEAVQRTIEQLAMTDRALTPREDEWLFCLFNHASLEACGDELTRRGIDGAVLLKDEKFIEFAEMMRGDVPLTTVYEQYRKTQGQKAKPLSTGPVEGQGLAGPPYFSQEQVKKMTRKQVKAHYNDIEKSRRFWR